MNDQELMKFIRDTARTANQHSSECHPCPANHGCPASLIYSMGTPPKGYFERMTGLARQLGWNMFRSWMPRKLYGEGCDGMTSGLYAPPNDRRACHIAPDLNPAQEFTVSAHELAHQILRHPVDTEEEAAMERMQQARTGVPEDFNHETSAHLAAVGASKAKGLRIGQPSVCYLAQRVRGHGRLISEDEIQAAFLAARMIRDAT